MPRHPIIFSLLAFAAYALSPDLPPTPDPAPLSVERAREAGALRLHFFGKDYGTLHLNMFDENYYHGGFRHWLGNGLGNAWQALFTRRDGRALPSYRDAFSDTAPAQLPPVRNVSP